MPVRDDIQLARDIEALFGALPMLWYPGAPANSVCDSVATPGPINRPFYDLQQCDYVNPRRAGAGIWV